MIQVQMARSSAYACCGKEQPNNVANLPKYAVQGRDATKPHAPESPRNANQCLFSVSPLYYTVDEWG